MWFDGLHEKKIGLGLVGRYVDVDPIRVNALSAPEA